MQKGIQNSKNSPFEFKSGNGFMRFCASNKSYFNNNACTEGAVAIDIDGGNELSGGDNKTRGEGSTHSGSMESDWDSVDEEEEGQGSRHIFTALSTFNTFHVLNSPTDTLDSKAFEEIRFHPSDKVAATCESFVLRDFYNVVHHDKYFNTGFRTTQSTAR